MSYQVGITLKELLNEVTKWFWL